MVDFELKGIYKITNLVNGKNYVGSTSKCFRVRKREHFNDLRKNKHKNQYFQNAWNKYGEDNFSFDILEIVSDMSILLEREDFWILELDVINKEKGYNINPSATGGTQFAQEVYDKRSITFGNTMRQAMLYYEQVKINEIKLADVPKKFYKLVESKLNHVVWNKGLDSSQVDYSYLKGVKKTKSESFMNAREKVAKERLEKCEPVLIYDSNANFLMEFLNIKELSKWSKDNGHTLPLILANPNGRNGLSPYILQSANIGKVCNGKAPHYKGLIFRFKSSINEVNPLEPEQLLSKNHQAVNPNKKSITLILEDGIEKSFVSFAQCDIFLKTFIGCTSQRVKKGFKDIEGYNYYLKQARKEIDVFKSNQTSLI